ncbi:MAG TPA: isoaspartyl peptidase/L-asparaginase [Gemmatimonadales bacterium]|jgi:beta-aspartyl-peptidase (threonine type)|nr:isoaspartyl peptidase/L-asparaginase [Gemmatimonadales bacterium]
MPQSPTALVIHGGAGAIRRTDLAPADDAAIRAALRLALEQGYAILRGGGASLDAVQAAITVLEDAPWFNAGKGSVLTSAGTVELDASIMDGATLAAGAVAAVAHVKNPIALARLVMDRSPHVLLAGAGAEAFARAEGMAMVPEDYFITAFRREQLRRAQAKGRAEPTEHYGTVGAVALDASGHLAAGTSTGGTANKLPGRVGDSPIIGAGTYADDRSCAVSATGHGEMFIRHAVAYDICARVRYRGDALVRAAEDVVLGALLAQEGRGGVIAIDRAGHIAAPFNTDGMYRGWVDTTGRMTVRIYRDE